MTDNRTVSWDDPFEMASEARELSGIDFLRGLMEKGRKGPIGVTLGFELKGRLWRDNS